MKMRFQTNTPHSLATPFPPPRTREDTALPVLHLQVAGGVPAGDGEPGHYPRVEPHEGVEGGVEQAGHDDDWKFGKQRVDEGRFQNRNAARVQRLPRPICTGG